METRCAIVVSAASSTCDSVRVGELSAKYRIGESAGFTFWNDGGVGICGGSWPPAFDIADWTSSAAPSRLRDRLN